MNTEPTFPISDDDFITLESLNRKLDYIIDFVNNLAAGMAGAAGSPMLKMIPGGQQLAQALATVGNQPKS